MPGHIVEIDLDDGRRARRSLRGHSRRPGRRRARRAHRRVDRGDARAPAALRARFDDQRHVVHDVLQRRHRLEPDHAAVRAGDRLSLQLLGPRLQRDLLRAAGGARAVGAAVRRQRAGGVQPRRPAAGHRPRLRRADDRLGDPAARRSAGAGEATVQGHPHRHRRRRDVRRIRALPARRWAIVSRIRIARMFARCRT